MPVLTARLLQELCERAKEEDARVWRVLRRKPGKVQLAKTLVFFSRISGGRPGGYPDGCPGPETFTPSLGA